MTLLRGRLRGAAWRRVAAWLCAALASAAWLLPVLSPPAAHAQRPAQAFEASLRAAYVYKFLAYIEWPAAALPTPESPIVIGVVGADDVHEELQATVARRTVGSHPVQARRLAETDPLDGLHAVFIGRGTRDPARLLARLRERPVLVVTERAAGLDEGSMINLVPSEGRIRFEASQAAAERSGLRLGARLLAVADRVITR